jgi:hypothetical protein
MKCPTDDTLLVMTDRNGIEIDYCPQCRGVWLDRGELDKIIDRSSDHPAASAGSSSERRQEEPRYEQRSERYDDHQSHDQHHKKRKKEGFLGDLFDF